MLRFARNDGDFAQLKIIELQDLIMTEPRPTFFGLRTHHLIMALIAVLIAVALASNYHLW